LHGDLGEVSGLIKVWVTTVLDLEKNMKKSVKREGDRFAAYCHFCGTRPGELSERTEQLAINCLSLDQEQARLIIGQKQGLSEAVGERVLG